MPTFGSATFNLKLKNPCIDPAFLTIDTTALPIGETYSLLDYGSLAKYEFTHTNFMIIAAPEVLTLCGMLSYSATF